MWKYVSKQLSGGVGPFGYWLIASNWGRDWFPNPFLAPVISACDRLSKMELKNPF